MFWFLASLIVIAALIAVISIILEEDFFEDRQPVAQEAEPVIISVTEGELAA